MAHGPSGMSGRLKSVRRVGVGLATDWIFKAGPPLTAFYKLFSGIFCALVLGAGAPAQSRDEPGGPDAPRLSGSTQPSSSSTVAPNTTSTGVHFNDPRRASANDDAAASVGGVSIDFDHLGIDPADLGGQNTLPTNLTALEADPNALLDALGDSDLTSLVQDAFDNDVGTGDFTDWVNSIMGGSTDPFEISGLSPSTPTSSCVTTPTRRETTQHSRYSCSVDDGTAVTQPACERLLVYPTDEDYLYECTETREMPSDPWSGQCGRFDEDAQCEQTDETCRQTVPAVPQQYQCESGQTVAYSAEQCTETREYVLDPDYEYSCTRRWEGDHWEYSPECEALAASPSCVETDTICIEQGPPILEDFSCEAGPGAPASTHNCTGTLVVDIAEDYLYRCEQRWDARDRSWVFVNPETCSAAATACTRVEDWSCAAGAQPNIEDRFCEVGLALTDTSQTCQQDLYSEADFDFDYEVFETFDPSRRDWVLDAAGRALDASADCTRSGETCVVTREPPRVEQECRSGFSLGSQNRTCRLPLEHQVDTDYVYGCARRFDPATRHYVDDANCAPIQAASTCQRVSETCTTPAPAVYDDYTCRVGQVRVQQAATVDRSRRVTVDLDYIYRCSRVFNTSANRFEDDRACGILTRTASCREVSNSCETTSPGVFSTHSCERGYRINQEDRSCHAALQVTVDEDYSYEAQRLWTAAQNRFDPSWAHRRLQQNGCVVTSTRCATPSPGVFTRHQCQRGWRNVSEARSCDQTLAVTVDEDYEYVGREDWSGSRFVPDTTQSQIQAARGCSRTNRRCTTASPGVYTTYTCRQGTVTSAVNQTCDVPLQVSAQAQYRHTCAFTSRNIYEPEWDNRCLSYSGCEEIGAPQCRLVGRGRTAQRSCTQSYVCSTSRIDGRDGVAMAPIINESWNVAACDGYASSCAYTGQSCVQGRATRTINGVAVTRDCWKYRRNYSCQQARQENTCSPPSGAQHVSDRCLRSEGGRCVHTELSYRVPQRDPSGGCHQYTNTFRCEDRVAGAVANRTFHDETGSRWDTSQCSAATSGASCALLRTVCTEGAATRRVNGMSVHKSCWRQRLEYSCTVRQDINTCNPPAGSRLKSQTCAWSQASTCRLFDRLYEREDSDPSGGCHAFTDTLRCENTVSMVGQPVALHHDITSEGFNRAQCGSLDGDSICRKTGTRCISGRATRTINGLAVTRDCWESEDTYACDVRQDINTCSPPVGSVLESRECVWSDAGGTCRLYRETHRREEADPSGGCLRYDRRFLCENYVGGIPLPVDTVRTVDNDYFDGAAQTSVLEQRGCVFQSSQCTSGPATRTISGLSVTRDCWAQRDLYQCQIRQAYDGCQPASHCTFDSERCVDTNADGSCSLVEKLYKCAAADGSDGCHVYTGEYRCQDPVSRAGPVLRSPRTVANGVFNDSQCSSHDADPGCRQTSTRCVDSDPATRLVAGQAVSADCWERERTYTCETRIALDECAGMTQCTLANEVCEQNAADGTCATRLRTYSCDVDDGSQGCAQRSLGFQCTSAVAAAGTPQRVRIASATTPHWDERCINSSTPGACVIAQEQCLDGPGIRPVRAVVSAQDLQSDPALAAALELRGVSEGSGHPNEIVGAGGLWRVTAAQLEAGSVSLDCARREVTYLCEVGTAVNTCDQYQEQAAALPTGVQYASTGLALPEPVQRTWMQRRPDRSPIPAPRSPVLTRFASLLTTLPTAQDRCDRYLWGEGCGWDREPELCEVYPRLCDGDGGTPDPTPQPRPGEGEIADCIYQDQDCIETSRSGACVRWRKRYSCEVGDGSAGCANRTDEWRCDERLLTGEPAETVYSAGERHWQWQGCSAYDDTARCRAVRAPYCTDDAPRRRPIGHNLTIEDECWELTQDYECAAVPLPNGCSPGEGCTLSSSHCLESGIDGSCIREARNYQCPGDDGSGGCAVSEVQSICETVVDGGGEPRDVVISVDGSSWVSSQCPAVSAAQSCEADPATHCVEDWVDPRPVRLWNWREGEFATLLEDRANLDGVTVGGCQVRERDYTCAQYSDATTCEIPDESCVQTAATCAQYDRENVCIRQALTYRCTAREAGCVDRSRTWRCEDLVDGAGQPGDVITTVGEPYWEQNGCDAFDDPELGCSPGEPVCTERQQTRIIGEQEIFQECWAEQLPYTCDGVGEVRTDCDPPEHCVLDEEVCLDDPLIGACRSLERRYACEQTVAQIVEEERCGSEITCFGGTCVETEREQSTNMPEALSRLAALGQAHETEGVSSSTLRLMGGEDLRCHKSGIWKNCCTEGGSGLSIDLLGGACSEQEQELAVRSAQAQCVEIGWFCARRGWFGCRKRQRTSCCFGSELARIVNEAGHDQLGLSWGTPASPNCEGLTPDQFARVDLSNVDLTSLFDDVVEGFAPDGQASVESRIRDRLSGFYSSGSSGTGSSGSGGSHDGGN